MKRNDTTLKCLTEHRNKMKKLLTIAILATSILLASCDFDQTTHQAEEQQKLYLGAGNINSNVNQLFYYCSPNNSSKYTRLVIFGSYDADGNGPLQSKNTYYPIVVDKTMLPNKNYVLNVTIKGIGVDTPTDDLNYTNLTVNLNVNNFEDNVKDVVLE